MNEKFIPRQDLPLNISIFRHGESEYLQKEVSIENADDLTAKGVEDVEKGAEELVSFIDSSEEVQIWSSPLGRTLQTAKIISQTLERKGIPIRKKSSDNKYGIKILKQLSEVKNFSWKLFYPLAIGGEVEFGGKKFFLDKNYTNPRNISLSRYFSEDGIKYIDSIYRQKLPKDYVQEIEGFEKFMDATKRLIRPLSLLKNINDRPYRIIIVTHDVLSGFIANIFSRGEARGINYGEFINIERVDGKLVATKVGNLENGDSSVDIIDEFNKKYFTTN